MNVTEKKPDKELFSFMGPDEKKIAIIGCNQCAKMCKTGGPIEVEELKKKLEEIGKEVVFTFVTDGSCDERLSKITLKKMKDLDADCIISMSCGSGNSVIADLAEVAVYPSNNSLFLGAVKRFGSFDERCSQCGDCVTWRTAGICPITRCTKGLLNGSCGGSKDGKCEVEKTRNCAWYMIYERLKKQNRLHYLKSYYKPKKYHFYLKPQKQEIK